MNLKKVRILGVEINCFSMKETIGYINESIKNNTKINHVVVNAGKYVLMQKDPELFKSVVESDIINADGQSIIWASRFLGSPLPERVAGIDLMESLVELSFKKGYKCFFLGAKEEVVKKVVDIYSKMYSKDIIGGYHNGYYSQEEEFTIAKKISESNSKLLFVAISSPKKEIFLNNFKEIIHIPYTMGVGGSFDVIAGVTKRAPYWLQKVGMEWFYRFIQEPKRMWKRYLFGNAKFIYLIFLQKIGLYKNPWNSK